MGRENQPSNKGASNKMQGGGWVGWRWAFSLFFFLIFSPLFVCVRVKMEGIPRSDVPLLGIRDQDPPLLQKMADTTCRYP